jgi:hypothetical protein
MSTPAQPQAGTHAAAARTVRQALAYAARGWPVFPCQPGGKEPATRHGFKDATTHPGTIRAWWQRNPAANLAIATGAPGPDVLDVDQHGPAGNGYPAWSCLRQAGLVTGAFAIIATPSGGLHAYFTGTTQRTARLPRHHLDLRAAGGCVLAPPSAVGGRPYQLITRLVPADPAPLDWAAVTRLLRPPQPSPAPARPPQPGDPGHLITWTAQLREGNRNSGLFWAACRLVENGHDHLLADLAAAAATTGLDPREIGRTIASARRTTGYQHPAPQITP